MGRLAFFTLALFASACGGKASGAGPSDASPSLDDDSASVGAGARTGDAGDDATEVSSVDASACTIVNVVGYDNSCQSDTDCLAVGQISSCPVTDETVCADTCLTGTVSATAFDTYMTAYRAAVVGGTTNVGCACPAAAYTCCLAGTCQFPCNPNHRLAACVDAGGTCVGPFGGPNNASGATKPTEGGSPFCLGATEIPDACVVANEVCCVSP